MSDRIIDPSTFSIPALALELQGHSMRFALRGNVYGNSMEFLVRVLSTPIPMGVMEQSAVYEFMRSVETRGDSDSNSWFLGGNDDSAAEKAFSFRGRIIGEPGRPSPHDFLPDPCGIDVAADQYKAVQLITLHTDFRSPAGYNGPVPRKNDIVKVSLNAGTQGPFSLQKAVFATLEKKTEPVADAIRANEDCESLTGLDFGGAQGDGGVTMNPPPTENQKVATHFQINIPMAGRYTSAYGVRRLAIYNYEPRPHWGIDIAAREGTDIKAPADGQRWEAGFSESENGGNGHYVRTLHTYHTDPAHTDKSTNNKAIVFTYCHMKEATNLTRGQFITRGTKVGECGGTGLVPNGYGKHLHFEAYVFDVPPGSLRSNGCVKTSPASARTNIRRKYLEAKRAKQDPIQVCRWDEHFSAGRGRARVTTSQSSKLNEDEE